MVRVFGNKDRRFLGDQGRTVGVKALERNPDSADGCGLGGVGGGALDEAFEVAAACPCRVWFGNSVP